MKLRFIKEVTCQVAAIQASERCLQAAQRAAGRTGADVHISVSEGQRLTPPSDKQEEDQLDNLHAGPFPFSANAVKSPYNASTFKELQRALSRNAMDHRHVNWHFISDYFPGFNVEAPGTSTPNPATIG